MIELAKVGLFFETNYEVVKFGERCCDRRVNLLSTVKRSYCIRRAEESDLEVLDLIEQECWDGLRVPKEELGRRIATFPEGQWVATIDGEIQAVLYTQRVASIDAIVSSGATVENQLNLHGCTNKVLQLITVSALASTARYQLGSSLRDFAVLLGRIDRSISLIAAVTRCVKAASILTGISEYENYVFSIQDPILQFHSTAGAEIVRILPGYRANDTENFGNGIILTYSVCQAAAGKSTPPLPFSIPSTPTAIFARADSLNNDDDRSVKSIISPLFHKSGFTPVSGKSPSPNVNLNLGIDYWTQLREIMLDTCQLTAHREKLANMDKDKLMESPFMDLGYDSLDLMAMKFKMSEMLQCELSNTLLFDHPTPKALLRYISNGMSSFDPQDYRLSSNDSSSNCDLCDSPQFAICGIGCRFPGQTTADPESFYQFLCSGKSAVTDVPKEWKTVTRYAAFLNEDMAESFDPSFFGLTLAEAESMDPNQRLLLEVCHEALQQSRGGSNNFADNEEGDEHERQRTGVFVGICNNDWNTVLNDSTSSSCGAFSSTGVSQAIAANRISFCFNLGGPSLAIDTACSSSFAALHTACNAIRTGDCDTAIVAASDLLLSESSLQVGICVFVCFVLVLMLGE